MAKSGIKLKHILVKKDPFENYCDCKPYMNALAEGITKPNCKKNRITYEAKCRNCALAGKDKTYFGETARNLHVRSKEHYDALKKRSSTSFMHKHIVSEHAGNIEDVRFDWKVLGKFQNPLQRQLNEVINIEDKSIGYAV